jgi:hypothetical protein
MAKQQKKSEAPARPGPAVEIVALASVKRHPDNPRRRQSVDDIRESIRANGFYRALVVQRSTRLVLAGNHSHEAAELEGIVDVPVVFVDVDDVTARRILLADNRTADVGDYDPIAILTLLSDLQKEGEGALIGTGFVDTDLAVVASLMDETVDVASSAVYLETWTAADATVSADFVFRCPAERQAEVRRVLTAHLPDVAFEEAVVRPPRGER